jgi:hypothetical protein
MARNRITNPEPRVTLLYNPYQVAFLNARRLRYCPKLCLASDGSRLAWSMLETIYCPACGEKGMRPFRNFFLRAGRRGGKTLIGALSAVEECAVPDTKGWCCAPSFPELEDYVIPAFFSHLPQEWFQHPLTEWSEDRLTLTLPNRSMVSFRSLDDPNRGAGPGLDWVWIDEGRKIQELAWQILRPTLIERKGIAWVTSTPDWGEDWCHKNFFVPATEGKPGFWATEYRTVDNPTVEEAEVEAARSSMPPELFRREFEASLEYPTGTIYGPLIDKCEADDDKIREWIPEWPEINPEHQAIAAMDPGTDHPFAAVIIVATTRGLVVVREYEEREGLFIEHARKLKGLVPPGLKVRWGIDRSAAQAAIELSAHGLYAVAAENDVEAGIQRVYSWMATGQMLIAKSSCPRLIKRLRHYRWAEQAETKRGVNKPTPFKKEDDLADALRYACMMWPELPRDSITLDVTRGVRNLSLLSPDARRQIERNALVDKDPHEDGLVRVTDDFTEIYDGFNVPLAAVDSPMQDFYR